MSDNIRIIANKCMDVLRNNVGTVELEQFIYFVRSQSFDYTKWQREHYDKTTPEELYESLKEYSKTHEFQGAKAKII